MDLGKLKGEEVMNGDHEVSGLDQREVVVREMYQAELGAEKAERKQRLFRQAIGLGVNRHQVRQSTDQGSHDRRILPVGNHGEALTEDEGEFGKKAANIATNAQRPDQARVEADPLRGQPGLMVSDP